jgi:hypothetical protein
MARVPDGAGAGSCITTSRVRAMISEVGRGLGQRVNVVMERMAAVKRVRLGHLQKMMDLAGGDGAGVTSLDQAQGIA